MKRFPKEEFERRRKPLNVSYLAANIEIVRLQNKLNVVQKEDNKITKMVGNFSHLVSESCLIFYSRTGKYFAGFLLWNIFF